MVYMERCHLAHLRQAAVLTAVVRSFDDKPTQNSGNVGHWARRMLLCSLLDAARIETQVRQELRQFDQALGLLPLLSSQFLAPVLLIQQVLQSILHGIGQLEVGYFLWQFDSR